jgi:hypothetical protein
VTMGSVVRVATGEGVAPLADVLTYRNDLVVRRFRKRFDISQGDADAIFVELLRWLWYLASTSPTPDNPEAHAIDEPLLIIDEMWHEFILVTQDYTNFCNDLCRHYIHHAPDSGGDARAKHEGLCEIKASLAALLGRKRAKYTAIYDVLGRGVFVLWYLEFPQRFSAEVISLMRKKKGGVDSGAPYVTDKRPQDAEQEKRDLIEEALFMNLLLSLPDEGGPSSTKEDGGQEAGEQGWPHEGTSPPTRCKSV